MRFTLAFVLMAGLLAAGCAPAVVESTAPTAAQPVAAPAAAKEARAVETAAAGEGAAAEAAPAASGLTPVPIAGGEAALTAENTKVEFVGIHLPPKAPDPRLGGFEKLSGTAKVDASGKALQSVNIEIDTTTVWTEVGGKLTNHLKTADFLETREYPAIKFASTKIEPGQGQCQITGQLTMHGVTKEVTFPATVEINETGLTLRSEFSVDRTEYGVNYQPNAVGKEVKITAVIGEKTQPRQGGGRGRGKGKGGAGQQGGGEQK